MSMTTLKRRLPWIACAVVVAVASFAIVRLARENERLREARDVLAFSAEWHCQNFATGLQGASRDLTAQAEGLKHAPNAEELKRREQIFDLPMQGVGEMSTAGRVTSSIWLHKEFLFCSEIRAAPDHARNDVRKRFSEYTTRFRMVQDRDEIARLVSEMAAATADIEKWALRERNAPENSTRD